jgi:gluconolactonase
MILFAALAATASTARALSQPQDVVAPGATLALLADGFAFTEGPAVDRRGNVFFTDQPNDRVMEWTTDGELRTFLQGSGRANGMYFDRRGHLIAAADERNELWSIAPDGSHTVILRDYGGRRLNGPNDLWIAPGGAIYFTDPLYARPWWSDRGKEREQDGEHLYYMSPDRRRVVRVDETLQKPNGIVGTPDGRTLYVADIGAGRTWAYDIERDGSLTGKRLFAAMGSDGMTIDRRGNLYLTGRGVTVFDPDGRQIAHIDVPGGWTANVVFGGRDRRTLFITASERLYSLDMNVRGVK